VQFGRKAKEFTAALLSEPFTLYTSFATAPGRSAGGRVYAFVVTAKGNDLASLLVVNGLGRAFGLRRETPGGVHHEEMACRLRDLEISAMLNRTGIWAMSDPDRIVQLRAEQRLEDAALREIQKGFMMSRRPSSRVNVNRASREELELIPGVGPLLAARLIRDRPYTNVLDLLRVRGIGAVTLEKIRPYLLEEFPKPEQP